MISACASDLWRVDQISTTRPLIQFSFRQKRRTRQVQKLPRKMQQKLNAYAGCQALRSASGYPVSPKANQEPIEFLEDLVNDGFVRLPCEFSDVFWIPDRVPIFVDIRKSWKSSILLRELCDRNADTGLVVDALISGKDAAHLLRLTEDMDEVDRWVRGLNKEHLAITIRSIDETKLVIATLRSYVFDPAS